MDFPVKVHSLPLGEPHERHVEKRWVFRAATNGRDIESKLFLKSAIFGGSTTYLPQKHKLSFFLNVCELRNSEGNFSKNVDLSLWCNSATTHTMHYFSIFRAL